MVKKIFSFSLALFSLLFVFGLASPVLAEYQACTCKDLTKMTVPSCTECLSFCLDHQGQMACMPVSTISDDGGSTVVLQNPLKVSTPQALIGKVINTVLGVVGSLALLMFVYGGLVWMTSSGSQEKVKKGRDIIVWSAIGLAIIFASYGLVRVLMENVLK